MNSISQDNVRECICCKKSITGGDDHVAILLFVGPPDSRQLDRVDYCVKCFIDNAAPEAISALHIDTKNQQRPVNDVYGYENASITCPLFENVDWHCQECHNKLSTTERGVIKKCNNFWCHGCGNKQFNICYRVKAK